MAKKQLWLNEEWHKFSERVKTRDGERCLQCKRSKPEVVLQVHHKLYVPGRAPWEYSLSDCITLCKGCHAREHGLIEPDRGWFLMSIDDLGHLIGTCEREGCGTAIRYEHLTYHPSWGYKKVGSTCIEHLTKEDILLSDSVLKLYKRISDLVHGSEWYSERTKRGKRFIETVYRQTHKIRIYGESKNYAFQILLKEKGIRWYKFGDVIPVKQKELPQVKELAYILLKEETTLDNGERDILRNLYRRISQ